MEYYVYLVRCADGTLYTGTSNHVERRVAAHNAGRGAKYTRSRLPVELVYIERCQDKSTALKREAEVKGLRRVEKERLVESYLIATCRSL